MTCFENITYVKNFIICVLPHVLINETHNNPVLPHPILQRQNLRAFNFGCHCAALTQNRYKTATGQQLWEAWSVFHLFIMAQQMVQLTWVYFLIVKNQSTEETCSDSRGIMNFSYQTSSSALTNQ
jgi:hypothetical protein